MAGKGAVLASRILNELAALGPIVGRVERAWKAAAANNDEFYYDSVALNIHSFYSGSRGAPSADKPTPPQLVIEHLFR